MRLHGAVPESPSVTAALESVDKKIREHKVKHCTRCHSPKLLYWLDGDWQCPRCGDGGDDD